MKKGLGFYKKKCFNIFDILPFYSYSECTGVRHHFVREIIKSKRIEMQHERLKIFRPTLEESLDKNEASIMFGTFRIEEV